MSKAVSYGRLTEIEIELRAEVAKLVTAQAGNETKGGQYGFPAKARWRTASIL